MRRTIGLLLCTLLAVSCTLVQVENTETDESVESINNRSVDDELPIEKSDPQDSIGRAGVKDDGGEVRAIGQPSGIPSGVAVKLVIMKLDDMVIGGFVSVIIITFVLLGFILPGNGL